MPDNLMKWFMESEKAPTWMDFLWHAGEVSDVKSANGHIIVEWIDTGVGLTGSDP